MNKNVQGNIWKIFIYLLSQRRSFIPLLSIYFLMLPNTNAQQIGLYSAIGFLAAFLIEIPSGYFSDRFGHKKTLISGKFMMIFSGIFFIFASNFWHFVIGSVFLSISFAFQSGTISAFIHDTYKRIKKRKRICKN